MAQEYLKELLVCKKCGKSYTSNYESCPHCEAEALAREISRKKKKQRPSAAVLGLSLALVLGAGVMFFGAFAADGLTVGQEHAVEDEEVEIRIVSSSVTQQRTQIDSFIEETDPPVETDLPEETGTPEE